MDAVIAVVPGNSAVISLVLALMLATGAVPTVKLMVPMDASHGNRGQRNLGAV